VGFRNALLERAVARLQRHTADRGVDIGRAIAVRFRIACQRQDRNYLTSDARER